MADKHAKKIASDRKIQMDALFKIYNRTWDKVYMLALFVCETYVIIITTVVAGGLHSLFYPGTQGGEACGESGYEWCQSCESVDGIGKSGDAYVARRRVCVRDTGKSWSSYDTWQKNKEECGVPWP